MVTCRPSRKSEGKMLKYVGNLAFGVTIAIPYVIITYCYICIYKKIRHHKNSIAANSSNIHPVGPQEIKMTWTLFAVLLGYLVTWFPVMVIGIMSSHDKSLPHHVTIVVSLCLAINGAINPMVYGVMNPAFRREYTRVYYSVIACAVSII